MTNFAIPSSRKCIPLGKLSLFFSQKRQTVIYESHTIEAIANDRMRCARMIETQEFLTRGEGEEMKEERLECEEKGGTHIIHIHTLGPILLSSVANFPVLCSVFSQEKERGGEIEKCGRVPPGIITLRNAAFFAFEKRLCLFWFTHSKHRC